MKKRIIAVLLLTFLSVMVLQSAYAEEEAIPERMRVGVIGKCGDMFEFRLAAIPTITSGISGYHAGYDMNFLILRVGIKNLTGDTVSLSRDSFKLTEVYNSIYYGTYNLDKAISYQAAFVGNDQPTYDDPIAPNEERPTTLVFDIYPNITESRYPKVTGWVFTFDPVYPNQNGKSCELRFLLPEAERY